MNKNQRKDVIQQIKDLSHSRKSVHIADLRLTGINFVGDDVIVINDDPGSDSIIVWDKISYFQDIGDSLPTETMFQNLENLISPRISDSDIASLSGLQDTAIEYQKNIRYTTIVSPVQTDSFSFTFTGECKATLYINDTLIMSHVYSREFPSTTTRITTQFIAGTDYKIEVFVYGHKSSLATNKIVNLSSELFRYIEYSRIPNIPQPRNVFATTNLPDTIKVSWEQNPTAPLTGGGTEVWAKSSEIDATYTYLDRVAHPTNFYIHSSQLGPQNVLPNGDLQDIIRNAGEDAPIPPGSPDAPEGILNWGLDYDSGEVHPVPSELSDYSTFIRYSEHRAATIPLSETVSSNILYASEAENLNTGEAINMNYTGTYYMRAGSSVAPPSGASGGWLYFRWSTSDIVTDADVRLTYYRNGSPYTVVTPDANTGVYSIYIGPADMAAWIADPAYIQGEFRLTPSDRNSDPTTTQIQLLHIEVAVSGGSTSPTIEFTSSLFPVVVGEEFTLEYMFRNSGTLNGIYTRIFFYDEYGSSFGSNTIVSYEDSGMRGSWRVFKKTVSTEGISQNIKFGKLVTSFLVTEQESGNSSIDIQRINLLKNSSKTLPPYDEYTYKLRNYTSELSLSQFTVPVTGATSEAVHYLTMSSEEQYVSSFMKSKLYVTATAPLGSVSVEALSSRGSYTIPIQQIGASSNGADFTFEYKPLFSVPVLYDTFNYDRRLANIANPPTIYNIESGHISSEDSPARLRGTWYISTPGVVKARYAPNDSNPWGLWPASFPNAEDFRSILSISNISGNNYKEYNLSDLSKFYRNIFGSNDIPDQEYHHTAHENATKISIGMIFRLVQEGSGTARIFDIPGLFDLVLYKNPSNNITSTVCWLKGSGFDGQEVNDGDIVFRHTNEFSTSDWYYLHISADVNALDDRNRTYITMHNVSNYPDTTVENDYIDGFGNYQDGILINRYEDWEWRWGSAQTARFGQISGGGPLVADFDQIYVTADVIEKRVIDGVCAQVIAESKNPYFSSFGYKSGQNITYFAEGLTQAASGIGMSGGAVPYDADVLTDEHTQTLDWEEPDGTVYILREAFTYNQDDIDELGTTQPLVTYSIWNKVYVDFTNKYSDVYKIRLSNDKITWDKWRNFNDQILYPWRLLPLGQPQDSTEGGVRNVYVQVVTKAGNTSDPWLKLNHSDDIMYNPLGSIGSIESWNYVKGRTGWALDLTGNAEFSSVTLREYALNLGKNLSLMKTREANVGTQIDAEYSRQTDHIAETTLPGLPNITSMTIDLLPQYPTESINYNSNFAVDLHNKDIIYVPHRNSVSNIFASRYNLGSMIGETIYYGDPSAAQDPYAMAHVALTEDYVYVAAKWTVYKYAKNNFTDGAELATHSLNYTAQGVKVAYNASNEIVVCVMSTSKAINKMEIDFLTEDLVQHTTQSFYLPGGAGVQPDYMANSFDYNGKYFVCVDYEGGVYRAPMGTNGLPVGPNINFSAIGINLHSLAMAYAEQDSYQLTPGKEFRVPTGIKLFGDIACAYTLPANQFLDFVGANHLNIFATLDFKTSTHISVDSRPISGVTSLMFIGSNTRYFTYGNHGFYCYMPQLLASEVSSAPSSGLSFPLHIPGGVLYGDGIPGGPTIWAEYGLGFTPPTLKDGKLITAYTSSVVQNNAASIISLEFDGKSVVMPPKVHTSFTSYKACSMFYSGSHMYWLGHGETPSGNHPLVFSRLMQ